MGNEFEIKDEYLNDFFAGKKILVTAGPTIERIDDVRFISNHSTGKMGYALANKAAELGADVTLISGPVHIPPTDNITLVNVQNANDMYLAAIKIFPDTDIAIMTAAVADFTPVNKVSGKIKKENIGNKMTIELKRTKDILSELTQRKTDKQKVVGFALESENEIENGLKKLLKKKCDIIVVNSAIKPDSGFGGDKNTITIVTNSGKQISYPPMLKSECALEILKITAME